MKAIPLIACLALVALQGRAQTNPTANAAAPAQPASLGDRARLYGEIKSFRAERPALPSDIERRLEDIEKSAGESQTADALAMTENNLKALREELAAKTGAAGTTSPVPDSAGLPPPALQKFELFTVPKLTVARADGSHFFDFTSHRADVSAFGSGTGARTAFSFINAPASSLGFHVGNPPSLDGPFTVDFSEWVQRNGIHFADFQKLMQLQPSSAETPAPPVISQPVRPSTALPSSLAALAPWIDISGVSDAVLDRLKTIHFLDKNRLTEYLLNGFGGYCYYGVKWMLTLVLPGVNNPKDLDLPVDHAYLLALALKSDPKLAERLHLLPLDLRSIPVDQADALPERTLLIWDRGCAGYDKDSGHVEFTLHADKMRHLDATAFYPLSRKYGFWVPDLDPKTQVLACSDGCLIQPMQKLRLYAGKCLSAYVPVIPNGD